MVVTIGVIGGLAYWDEQRESDAALGDFAREQVTLARSVAGRSVQDPGRAVVLTVAGDELITSAGLAARCPAIEQAIKEGRDSVRLTRTEALALGLPERTAMAGIDGSKGVVVVATALRERDREKRAEWRLALSFLLSSAAVLFFGSLALRIQRKELRLEKDLAVADAVRERDARLVRADKLATLGALGIGIAHEVSTPLGVIVGRAEQLGPRIAEQAERIGKIIRAMLGLARGGGKAAFEQAAPSAIASDAVDLVRHRFDKAGVSLTSRLDPDLPPIACDPPLFTQVVVNLLLNACEACAGGAGNVELRVSAGEGRVVFSVIDDGHGITADDAARATEPFFTTKPPGQGTGLGLAIAREIVLHHGGGLRLAARLDGVRGTEAAVDVPSAGKMPDG
jgi:signal transduction histidine kinase